MLQGYVSPEREWAQQQIEQYRRLFPRYQRYAETLHLILTLAARQYAPDAIIQTRAKTIASFAEKIQRKRRKYHDPVNQMTDLCGARVIAHTPHEVWAVCDFIEKNFAVDWENTVDVSQRLKATEFGYRSVHYVVQCKNGVFQNLDTEITLPDEILGLKAEIQVRTILEHAWADFSHRMMYKSPFPIPVQWQREFAGLAAMLERADAAFAAIETQLKQYMTSYGAYMSAHEMRQEIALLELVLNHDPENRELAHRIGKLAIALGDWEKAIDVLSRFAETGSPPILRDLGVALCKQHKEDPTSEGFQKGRHYLEKAAMAHPRDADALASLAGTWKRTDPSKAAELYREAFEANNDDPYALGQYLEYEILKERNTRPVGLLRPLIRSAIQRCRERADIGVDLPWAFYDIGKFSLLLGNPYESLDAYTKAVQLTNDDWMIETALHSLERLSAVADALPGHAWIEHFLWLARAIKFNVDEAHETLRRRASAGYAPIRGPVVLIAGACDESEEQLIQSYRPLLIEAFRGFCGTVISGGTRAGVAGLAGDVQQSYPGSIRTIGYLPQRHPYPVEMDERYVEIRYTAGNDFTPLEPLQYWTDLIVSGVPVSDVKLIGLSGGKIAALEYRIALALGAQVAVIEASGRAAAKLLSDDRWRGSSLLICLPADSQIVHEFIHPAKARLTPSQREHIARAIHRAYCEAETELLREDDPALAPWDDLLECFKESNRLHADNILDKLRLIGCRAVPATDSAIKLIEFTEAETEILARAEHARWVIERMCSGWKPGDRRDVAQKLSPYLVSWDELPAAIQERSRRIVRQIPAILAEIQLEIQRSREEEKRDDA